MEENPTIAAFLDSQVRRKIEIISQDIFPFFLYKKLIIFVDISIDTFMHEFKIIILIS